MSEPEVATRGTVPLAPILTVNFVGTLGFSIVLPFLVFVVTRWGGNALVYGVIGATYSAFQLIGAPILGRWSDRVGRRKVLLVSQAGTLVSWLIFLAAFFLPDRALLDVRDSVLGTFTLTVPLLVLFVARAADGLTGGNISVATAYLSDISADDDRNANFGKLAVSANLGFILGPAIAGLLAGTRLREIPPVLAAIAISALATWLIAYRLPESRPCVMDADRDQAHLRRVFGGEQKPCYEVQGAARVSVRDILSLNGVPVLLAIYFVVMAAFNVFYVAFPVNAVRGLQWSVRETGVFFAVLSALMAVVQGPVLRWATRRWSDATLVRAGSLLLAFSFLSFTSTDTAVIFLGAALLALGNGLMWPSVVSLLSRRAGDRYQGAVQGLAGSSGAAASILGLVVGGMLFDVVGARVFAISAVLIGVVFLMAWGLRPPGTFSKPAIRGHHSDR